MAAPSTQCNYQVTAVQRGLYSLNVIFYMNVLLTVMKQQAAEVSKDQFGGDEGLTTVIFAA